MNEGVKTQVRATLTLEPKVLKGLLTASSTEDDILKSWPQVPAVSLRCSAG